jgi:hypothetical protein
LDGYHVTACFILNGRHQVKRGLRIGNKLLIALNNGDAVFYRYIHLNIPPYLQIENH